MKTTDSSRPPLSCRVTRLRLSLSGDPKNSAHLRSCPSCQEYFAAIDQLDRSLRSDAASARIRETASDDLEREIVSTVRRSAAPARFSPAPWRAAVLSFGAVAACAAIVFFVSRQPTPGAGTGAPAVVAGSTAVVASGTADFIAALRPEAAALLRKDPLQDEVNAVVADAQSALQFLALNFLPSTPKQL